jgi:hypothetical protein
MPAGRPKKYATPEEAHEAKLRKLRERYAAKKSTSVRDYDRAAPLEEYRGTKAYRLYYSSKSRSKKYGLPFDLDVHYIQDLLDVGDVCPLLGVPYDDGKYTQSLDKIIPELGYTKGNVWIVSYRANSIKNDASLEELQRLTKALEAKLTS